MFVPPQPVETFGKVCENSWAGEIPLTASINYKIIWTLCMLWLVCECFHSSMKHGNDMSNMVGCYENLQFRERNKTMAFLFVKTEINNFITRNKTCSPCLIALWKPWQSLWEFSSRWKCSTASWVFTDLLLNSPKCSPWFLLGYKGM